MANVIDVINYAEQLITPKEAEAKLVSCPVFDYVYGEAPSSGDYPNGRKAFYKNGQGVLEFAKDYNGGADGIIQALNIASKVEVKEIEILNPVTGEVINSGKCGIFDENGKYYNAIVSKKYTPIQFSDSVYFIEAVMEAVRARGVNAILDVGKTYDHDAKMFLQYKIEGQTLLGEPTETKLSILNSYDGSLAFGLFLSDVRLWCQNQVSRMLKNCTQSLKIRHTKIGKEIVEAEAKKMIEASNQHHLALEGYLKGLSTIPVTPRNIYDAWLIHNGINPNEQMSLAAATRLTNRLRSYYGCLNMPDVDNWRGTALGAYYAYTDFNDHIMGTRQTNGDNDNRLKTIIYNGNPDVGNFIDTLVKVAG